MHVEERLSCPVIAKRVQEQLGETMSPKLVCQMVNEIARMSKSSVEIKRKYRLHWSGYLTIDDKWVRLRGQRVLSLVAVDKSGDPVHSELHDEQTQEVYDNFLVYLRGRLEYPFRAVTTDFDRQLGQAVEHVLPPVLAHQKCNPIPLTNQPCFHRALLASPAVIPHIKAARVDTRPPYRPTFLVGG